MHKNILICNELFPIGMIYATTKYFSIILELFTIGIDIWRYYVIMGSIQDNNNTTAKATQWTSSQSQCWPPSLSPSPWSASGMPSDTHGVSKLFWNYSGIVGDWHWQSWWCLYNGGIQTTTTLTETNTMLLIILKVIVTLSVFKAIVELDS